MSKNKLNFSKMSNSNVGISCWLEDGMVDVSIRINNKGFHTRMDQVGFYDDLLSALKIMNISSFTLTVYSKGEHETWNSSFDFLEKQLKKWKGEIPLLQNIDEILKLK